MSLESEGYLVVDNTFTERFGYTGMYSGVPWDQKAFENGFDDPFMTKEFWDFDLLPTMELATPVLDKYAELYPLDSMAILFARLVNDPEMETIERSDLQFLGYDVASLGRPFYSIVLDRPRDPEPPLDSLLNNRTQHGLFKSAEEARQYHHSYMEFVESGADVCAPGTLAVWEVSLVLGKQPLK